MTGLMLPYARFRDFLPGEDVAALLSHVIESQSSFSPAMVRRGNDAVHNASRRVALTSANFGSFEPLLRRRFLDALPAIMAATGASGPAPSKVELELAAHGDGAFYSVHTDLPIGETRKQRVPVADRVLSCVLYFHAEPKGFSGGELRLLGLGPDAGYVELQPLHNCLVAFHSWVPHEVRPVSCPSGAFRDYRFAVNCWFRRKLVPSRTTR